jgi:ABC-type bacteriocin/lantibiotic exporter with double-glycine peptidase domain
MWQTFTKIRDLLEPGDFRRLVLVLGMILVAGTAETASVVSIMPFMAVLGSPDAIEVTWYLSPVYNLLGFGSTETFLIFLGIVVLACLIITAVCKLLANWAMLNFTSRRSYTLSRSLFEGYLHQPYTWFLGKHSADLSKTVLSEVDQVINGALIPAIQLINYALILLFLIAILIVVEAVFALPFIVVLGGAYSLIFWTSRHYLHRAGEIRVRANMERFRLTSEALGGIKEIKVLGLEDSFLRRFEEPSRLFVRAVVVRELIGQIPQYALPIIAFIGVMLIIQYQLFLHGNIGQALPLIALFVVAGSRLTPAFQGVYQSWSRLRFAQPALAALLSDLPKGTVSLSASDDTGSDQHVCLRDQLELRHISYRYPGASIRALDDVSLIIPARALVGLVGQTGAGKTTLADVILGLLNFDTGQMLIDGAPIAVNSRDWQRSVGYVPQHIFLADDSVAANIAFGIHPAEIDMRAVKRAAQVANLNDFVTRELECSYDTIIGERGVRLSGGQRQRLGIARALYRDPSILIMDEATNALDTITERAVMDAVANLAHKKTIIMVAHRIATVRYCDIIFLLERGRILASGSYDALVDDSTRFREMVG